MSKRTRWLTLAATVAILLLLVAHAAGVLAPGAVDRPPSSGARDSALESRGRGPDGLGSDPPVLHGQAREAPPAAARASVTGRVVDADTGLGISDVEIACLGLPLRVDPGRRTRQTITSEDGQFTLEDLEPGTWLLLPSHSDYMHPLLGLLIAMQSEDLRAIRPDPEDLLQQARANGVAFRTDEKGTGVEPLLIQMTRGALVTGRITGPDGTPIAQSPVFLNIPHWGPLGLHWPGLLHSLRSRAVATSDGEGRFEVGCLPLALGQVRLGTVHPTLLCRWSDPLVLSDPEDVHLQLCEPAAVEGRVLWSDGRPEAGARVRLEASPAWVSLDAPLWSTMGEGYTDEKGRFRFAHVPPDAVTLRAFAAEDDVAQAELTVSGLAPGETRTGLQVTFDDQHFIRGRLVSPNGEPVHDECIRARGEAGEEDDWDLDHIDWTDEEGRFALEVPTECLVEVWLETGNREVRLATDVHVPCEDLVLVAQPTPNVTFTVQVNAPDGRPVPYFRLCGWPSGQCGQFSEGEVGRNGRATVEVQGLPPYHVYVKQARDGEGEPLPYAPYGVEVTAESASTIEVTLSRKAEFYGRILDLEDEPIPGVRLLIDEGDGEREIPVAEDGRFRFAARDPAVREISEGRLVLPEGYRDWTYVLILRAGVYRDIRAKGGGLPAKGRVVLVGEGSASLSDLAIELDWGQEDDVGEGHDAEVETDEEGYFACYALPEDAQLRVNVHAYSLEKNGLIAVDQPVVVPAGTTDIVLSVRVGASIGGRVVGPGLAQLDYTDLRVCVLPWHGFVMDFYKQTAPTPTSTSFRVEGLAPGRYRVALFDLAGRNRLLAWADDVEAGREDTLLRVPRLDGVIHGTLDTKGLGGVDGMLVAAVHQDGANYMAVSEATPEGHFRIDRLDPSQRYTVHTGGLLGDVWKVALRSDVRPGQHVDLEWKTGLSIQGRIVGQHLQDLVAAVRADGHGVGHLADFDPTDGTFRFEGLYPGTYELTVLGPGLVRRESQAGVEAGSTDVVLRLN